MIRYVSNSFDNINFEVIELINICKEVKNNCSDDNIQTLLSLQISNNVLYDYITWYEKLENTFMESGEDEIIYIPNTTIKSKIISFIANNSKSNDLNCWLPFLGGIGLGFLLDDE